MTTETQSINFLQMSSIERVSGAGVPQEHAAKSALQLLSFSDYNKHSG